MSILALSGGPSQALPSPRGKQAAIERLIAAYPSLMRASDLPRIPRASRLPMDLLEYRRGRCPSCGGDLVHNAYHAPSNSSVILVQCFGALGADPSCHVWNLAQYEGKAVGHA